MYQFWGKLGKYTPATLFNGIHFPIAVSSTYTCSWKESYTKPYKVYIPSYSIKQTLAKSIAPTDLKWIQIVQCDICKSRYIFHQVHIVLLPFHFRTLTI